MPTDDTLTAAVAAPTLALTQEDSWLQPYEPILLARQQRLADRLAAITKEYGSLSKFATAHQRLGLHYDARRRGYVVREWAPSAEAVSLVGDFNFWNREADYLQKDEATGVWEGFIADDENGRRPAAGTRYKLHVVAHGQSKDRLPAYLRRAVQDEVTKDYSAQVWVPENPFKWTDQTFRIANATKGQPLIYEAHVGMAQEQGRVGTYREFADYILPRIQADGYNTIQLMAILEHPYYGSFGYHVANFFAPSSRFGTPDDLKYLINEAHKRGLAVLLDLVHSHAVKNEAEGLADFDGSGNLYFHKGARGNHPGWDSKLFDYGRPEVQQFLLSNLRYWLEEFHFDGFRFDGVTSMLYHHHGEGHAFGGYDSYFGPDADDDAILYLMLASTLVREVKKSALLIAEDMSGLPGLCRPIAEGGVGFDYRLAMGLPDFWIKNLKHKRDEDWDLGELWHQLTNRRAGEKTVAYAESHDQALVGDKTLSHWLYDSTIYTNMGVLDGDPQVARATALHKLIRLITLSAGGEAYLTFMGNEFGHPEWVDFPRAGNDWSYHYARRQWSLADNPDLRFHQLGTFDQAMLQLARERQLLTKGPATLLNLDYENRVLTFERAGLVFVFSFNVSSSFFDYSIPVPATGRYRLLLSTDRPEFGGFARLDEKVIYDTFGGGGTAEAPRLRLYVPSRTALVLVRG
ncbi:alpha-amylase family glycosyl hydrolase [Hymenobacter psoromatis]|uniref:alpha-amylase family glycosyl hydrolase n=1 Tax=Hymenobacter psoromatis TaxID=1484116 RepID=UPI001CC0CBD7|nr:alpha-amylase family glycosyl hydrolase [Hymenobacter psoromatis]